MWLQAQLAIEQVHRSKMAGREVTCEYFDNITDYRMKEDETKVEERVESFVSPCNNVLRIVVALSLP